MTKQQILKLTGLSEAEFYAKYPTKEAFYKAYPNAKKMMQEGGSLSAPGVDPTALNKDRIRKERMYMTPAEQAIAGIGAGILGTLTGGATNALISKSMKDRGLENTSAFDTAAGITTGLGSTALGFIGMGGKGGKGGKTSKPGTTDISGPVDMTNPNAPTAPDIPGNNLDTDVNLAMYGGMYRNGGHMNNSKNLGLTDLKGPSHADGGIALNEDVEVEGKETIYTPERYVFSEVMKASKDALKDAGLSPSYAGKSYASISKSFKNSIDTLRGSEDKLAQRAVDQKLKKLIEAHEVDREIKRQREAKNVVASTPQERAGGYNMFPNAESIMFPGQGQATVVPADNGMPIEVTGADGSQQILTNSPIQTQAPFMERKMAAGGMLKRADGSYSKRGLWDNIRAKAAANRKAGKKGKKPTKEMLEQEAKIRAAEKAYGGYYYEDGGYFMGDGSDQEDGSFWMSDDDRSYMYGGDMDTYPQEMAEGGRWIQKAVKGMRKDKPCTGSKFGGPSCPPGSKRYNLAKTFRKMAKSRKEEGGLMYQQNIGTLPTYTSEDRALDSTLYRDINIPYNMNRILFDDTFGSYEEIGSAEDFGYNPSIEEINEHYENPRKVGYSDARQAAIDAFRKDKSKMYLTNDQVAKVAKRFKNVDTEGKITFSSPAYGDTKYDLKATLSPLDYWRVMQEINRGKPDAKKAIKKSKGGKLPEGILRARLESHMSPSEVENYMESYAYGGDLGSPNYEMYVNSPSYYRAEGGSFDNPGFRALPKEVQEKIKSNMAMGGMIEYGSGGYTVRRSNDRKGKTHVVTGPDGTKKYFGDPNLGERGKSKYGKEAFYARHKKNLAKNPYFRAYARATWQDGGYTTLSPQGITFTPTINRETGGEFGSPDNNYYFEDASGSYLNAMADGGMMYQQNVGRFSTNPTPERADSLALLNSVNRLNNFYKNSGFHNPTPNIDKYTMVEKAKKGEEEKTNLKTYLNMLKDLQNIGLNDYRYQNYKNADPSFTPLKYAQKLGEAISQIKNNTNPYISYYRDLYPSKIDIEAPPAIYDTRITPQGIMSYETSGFNATSKRAKNFLQNSRIGDYSPDLSAGPAGMISGFYYYDPIAITPWDMLNESQLKQRIKEYGQSGIPRNIYNKYTKKSQPSNITTSNEQQLNTSPISSTTQSSQPTGITSKIPPVKEDYIRYDNPNSVYNITGVQVKNLEQGPVKGPIDPATGQPMMGYFAPTNQSDLSDIPFIPKNSELFIPASQYNQGNISLSLPNAIFKTPFGYSKPKGSYGVDKKQEGGMMANPEATSEADQQMQQIMQAVVQMLQEGNEPNTVVQALVQNGIAQEAAGQIVGSVMREMQGGAEQAMQQQMPINQGMPMAMGGKMMYQQNVGTIPDDSDLVEYDMPVQQDIDWNFVDPQGTNIYNPNYQASYTDIELPNNSLNPVVSTPENKVLSTITLPKENRALSTIAALAPGISNIAAAATADIQPETPLPIYKRIPLRPGQLMLEAERNTALSNMYNTLKSQSATQGALLTNAVAGASSLYDRLGKMKLANLIENQTKNAAIQQAEAQARFTGDLQNKTIRQQEKDALRSLSLAGIQEMTKGILGTERDRKAMEMEKLKIPLMSQGRFAYVPGEKRGQYNLVFNPNFVQPETTNTTTTINRQTAPDIYTDSKGKRYYMVNGQRNYID